MTVAYSLPLFERFKRKGIGLGAFLFYNAGKIIYRLRSLGRARLIYVDHITFPCTDLKIAEAFYVGLMGARVVMRIDRPLLLKMGWSEEQIDHYRAVHLSLTLAGGPRLDLFEYPSGRQREGSLHPHVAFRVGASQFSIWKKRLMDNGVKVSGPTRPGPPGQASFYFNDPFGNHLEIVAMGIIDNELPPGMNDRSHLDYDWKSSEILDHYVRGGSPKNAGKHE
jgi:catechol 2,3-dioxygenase-like lactoylglutathione lyase family enzyme